MEVASPLTFGHVQAGTKRRFACSPILDASMGVESSAVDDYTMEETSNYGHATKKRRRFGSSEGFEGKNHIAASQFISSLPPSQPVSNHALGKRQRTDDCSQEVTNTYLSSNASLLHKEIQKQNLEIQNLRNEKASMESTINSLTETQATALNENKILKKAVALQQQRQNQALSELESAREYREQAEHKIKMLEQVVNSLRYHLQAQQPHVGNDFMNLNNRPPDVF